MALLRYNDLLMRQTGKRPLGGLENGGAIALAVMMDIKTKKKRYKHTHTQPALDDRSNQVE